MPNDITITHDGCILSRKFGDMTRDVILALVKLSGLDEPLAKIEHEQAQIARLAGTTARDLACGQLVAQIHPTVYQYWLNREGPGFWKDQKNLAKFLRDHPSVAVKSKPRKTTIRVNRV